MFSELKNLNRELPSYLTEQMEYLPPRSFNNKLNHLKLILSEAGTPDQIHRLLLLKGYSPYYIKTAFGAVAQFERLALTTTTYQKFVVKMSRIGTFKNAYVRRIKAVTTADLVSAIQIARDQKRWAIYNFLILMAGGGLRLNEARLALWTDYDGKYLRILGKGSKYRTIPFRGAFREFQLVKFEGSFISGKCYYEQFFKDHLHGYTPKDLRAYFITEMANQEGVTDYDVSELAGHSSTAITKLYYRSNLDKLGDIMENKLGRGGPSHDQSGFHKANE